MASLTQGIEVLKMLQENFKKGDALTQTTIDHNDTDDISAQAFKSGDTKKLLILNKRKKNVSSNT